MGETDLESKSVGHKITCIFNYDKLELEYRIEQYNCQSLSSDSSKWSQWSAPLSLLERVA